MKALYFDGQLNFRNDCPEPAPAPGEALIRVLVAGICSTDYELMAGYKMFKGILGHEFVGLVEEVNGPERDLVGQRVVGGINLACGACESCSRGLERHCPDRRVLGVSAKNGAFAERLTLPVQNLYAVPFNVGDEEAVFTEPLAAALQVACQVAIRPGWKVAVLGDGRLGLLAALTLKHWPIELDLVGRHPEKLAVASNGGVNTMLVSDLSVSGRYDLVVEATGNRTGLELALNLARPGGTVALKTTCAFSSEAVDFNRLVVNELTVVGSRCGPFAPALKLLARERIDVKPLISAVYEKERALEAFEAGRARKNIKVLIDFRS